MPPIVIALPHRCHETVADGGQHPRAVGGCGMPDMATMLETALQQRYPQWFVGRRGHWLRPLVRGFGRWSGLARAERFLDEHAGLQGLAFVRAALAWADA